MSSFIFRTNQGKSYTANTYFIFGKPAPVTINSVVSGSTGTGLIAGVVASDVSNGTAVTNGINYNVYSFQPGTGRLPASSTSSQATYTINYSCVSATTIYVLAVGGGGGGTAWGGAGGGAGGVVMNPVYLQAGSSSITISVGAGGIYGSSTSSASISNPSNGSNTTVNFTANSSANILAWGGGSGGSGAVNSPSGGSGGGGGNGYFTGGTSITNYNNYGNAGGNGLSGFCGGGGGAGTIGINGVNANNINGGAGGNGIQCFLPGISTFAPSGSVYSNYYWGGGGGGSSSTSTVQYGNGGLGGGGGGTSATTAVSGGGGGINGLNNGTNGINSATLSTGGAGGTNTGGGGGAVWWGTGGSGGSGIVVIAFPSATAVTSNQSAVLPASIFSRGLYSATLNNATLTSLAYNSIKGAYACRLLNYNYFGPIMTLRCSTDICGNYTQNFYSDICGNMGTGYLGTGQSVSTWLSGQAANTTYAYVTKWYGQGMDVSFNCATQYTTTLQPVYDVATGVLNFGYTGAGGGVAAPQTGCYFNLPNGALPYNDASYSYVTRHYNVQTTTTSTFISGGGTAGTSMVGTQNSELLYDAAAANGLGVNYLNGWVNLGYAVSATAYAANNVLSSLYSSGSSPSLFIIVNGTKASRTGSAHVQTNLNNAIGYNLSRYNSTQTSYGWALNGQLYNMYVFSTALSDSDRGLIEASPYQYSVPPTITGLSASQVTSTTFVLNWSTVANATSYVLWINGSYFATYNAPAVTTGTVTPSTSGGLWTLNLYAYNSANVLLATGSTGAVMMAGAILSSNTGATQTTNGTNTVFTFTSSGTFTPITTGYASVLIVGGGGYGGSDQGSGGGAGGLVYFDSNYEPMLLTAGTAYTVTVGTGGVNSTSTVATNSSFNSVIATAGGSGAGNGSAGVSGGSSSGCGTAGTTQAASTQASYVTAYFVGGNKGGTSTGTNGVPTSGGGGGAGGAGGNSTGIAPLTGGSGGIGYQSNITGGNVYYSGGGGGMGSAVGGIGGSGIGGTGGTGGTNGGVGGNATGYGSGGGAGVGGGVRGGNGSNGVVIISCQGLTAVAGLATSSVTATNFVLSWTTVANISYILWINGIKYGTVTTGSTITPSTSGPWTLGLYGYNASNVLVYYGTTSSASY